MLLVEKATTLIQQVLADRQADHEQMMGGNFAASASSRAARGSP
jgi:hypothetical protein